VQLCEFFLQQDMRVVIAGDVAGAARSAAGLGNSPVHGSENVRMPTHAKVVIAAPHGDEASVPSGRRQIAVGNAPTCRSRR
jgi:hypothetical protein